MRKYVIAGSSILIGLVAVVSLIIGSKLPKPSINVGGIRYRIEGVTYGTNHHFATGLPFLNGLRRVLPQSWQGLLPSEIRYDNQTTEPEAVVYLSAYDIAKSAYVSPPWDFFRTVDEHGCVFYVNSWSSASPGSALSVSMVHLRSFPRRAGSFRLRARVTGGTTVELTVPNPDRSEEHTS